LLLFGFACLDHATSNAAQLRVLFPFRLSVALAAIRHFQAFYALIPLVVAIYLDRSVFKCGLADEPTVTLPAERQSKLGIIALTLRYLRKPHMLRDLWSYVLQRRAFAWSKAVSPSDQSLATDRASLVAWGVILERHGSMSSAAVVTHPFKAPIRAIYQRILPPALQRFLLTVFAIPPLLFFVIGDFPSTARLQDTLATPTVFRALICLLIASTIWQVVVLVGQALALSYMRNNESIQGAILYYLSLWTAVGAIIFSLIALAVLPNHGPLQQIRQDRILSALVYPLTLVIDGFMVVVMSVSSFVKSLENISVTSIFPAVLVTITSVGSSASVPATSGEAAVGTGIGEVVPDPPAAETTSLLLRYAPALQKWLSYIVWDGNTEKARSNFDNTWKSADPKNPNAGQ